MELNVREKIALRMGRDGHSPRQISEQTGLSLHDLRVLFRAHTSCQHGDCGQHRDTPGRPRNGWIKVAQTQVPAVWFCSWGVRGPLHAPDGEHLMTASKPPSSPVGEGSGTAENVTYHRAAEAASDAWSEAHQFAPRQTADTRLAVVHLALPNTFTDDMLLDVIVALRKNGIRASVKQEDGHV